MTGTIVKGIAGFYYVYVNGSGVYECKAKGAFRKAGIKPLVGDSVEIAVLDEEKKLGNVEKILPRKNAIVRPAVANVDQALVIFATASPEPNLNLLDRFLVMMEYQNVPVHICFNKMDLSDSDWQHKLADIYINAGYQVHFTKAKNVSVIDGNYNVDSNDSEIQYNGSDGVDEIRKLLKGKITTVAGPSGVGKSTLINCLKGDVVMETGSVSEKIGRGKHTTRHSQLIYLGDDTFIVDTPGFSSMYIPEFEKEDLKDCYPEFDKYANECKFLGCVHINEPKCGVKDALARGEISQERYDNYKLLYEEIASRRKY
ncbi:MAG: ribosome small subunit-dependent GTPase A [Lachnospiraceae bacterium]|nr:ribosome small subunit-dependent GTPase A [Lachnospiraceae bacterium]